MFQATPPEDLAESERRVREGIARFEGLLGEAPWLAGETFSLADIGVFATLYSLPLSYPDAVSADLTPHLWDWLRRCHARPGLRQGFACSRGFVARRAVDLRALLGVAEQAA